MFDSLPKDEQDSILDPKGTASGKTSATAGPSNAIDLTGDDAKSPPQPSKKKKENEDVWLPSSLVHYSSPFQTSAPKVSRPKKIVDSDRTAKVCTATSVHGNSSLNYLE
jgi:hypothetical protein